MGCGAVKGTRNKSLDPDAPTQAAGASTKNAEQTSGDSEDIPSSCLSTPAQEEACGQSIVNSKDAQPAPVSRNQAAGPAAEGEDGTSSGEKVSISFSSVSAGDGNASQELAQKYGNASKELAHYREQRELQREQKKARKKRSMSKAKFLSHVPEFDQDVQYRFTFFVVSDFADKLVELVCNSGEVPKLPCITSPYASEGSTGDCEWSGSEGFMSEDSSSTADAAARSVKSPHPLPSMGMSASSGARSRSGKNVSDGYRCLCPVPYPWGRLSQQETSKYAKLVLKPMTFDDTIPRLKSSLEAQTTALVFAILVDPIDSLQQQLQDLLHVVRRRREAPRELRPVWAVILCQPGSSLPGSEENGLPGSEDNKSEHQEVVKENWGPWASAIDNFEQLHGSLWKFGAVGFQDADQLYSVFAKIASQRIYSAQNPDNEIMEPMASECQSCESSQSAQAMYSAEQDDIKSSDDLAPCWEAERGDDSATNNFDGIAPAGRA